MRLDSPLLGGALWLAMAARMCAVLCDRNEPRQVFPEWNLGLGRVSRAHLRSLRPAIPVVPKGSPASINRRDGLGINPEAGGDRADANEKHETQSG
jgi:hypothetical protein